MAACRLSLVMESGGCSPVAGHRLLLVGTSLVLGTGSRQASFGSWGAQAQLPCVTWNLPRLWIEPSKPLHCKAHSQPLDQPGKPEIHSRLFFFFWTRQQTDWGRMVSSFGCGVPASVHLGPLMRTMSWLAWGGEKQRALCFRSRCR